MAGLTYSNFALSTLSQGAATDTETIYITDHTLFPTGEFTAVIWSSAYSSPLDDANREIVRLTGDGSDTFTAQRGQEETSAYTWISGSLVANIVTADSMNSIETAVGSIASATYLADSTYDMERGDTKLICTFSSGESEKTVNLPEGAICEGLRYTIINTSDTLDQRIKLYPYLTDSYAHTSGAYIRIPSDSSAELVYTTLGWRIVSLENRGSSAIRTTSDDYPDISFADGTVYIDTSAGDINIVLPDAKEIAGRPLSIVKYTDDSNIVSITGYDGDGVELSSAMQSAQFIMLSDGSKQLITASTSSGGSSAPVSTGGVYFTSTDYQYTGEVNYVLVTTGAGYRTTYLRDDAEIAGVTVTVKKIDSGVGMALVTAPDSSIDDSTDAVLLSSQYDYATFTYGGDQWYRVG